jgi:hypothetical protein
VAYRGVGVKDRLFGLELLHFNWGRKQNPRCLFIIFFNILALNVIYHWQNDTSNTASQRVSPTKCSMYRNITQPADCYLSCVTIPVLCLLLQRYYINHDAPCEVCVMKSPKVQIPNWDGPVEGFFLWPSELPTVLV